VAPVVGGATGATGAAIGAIGATGPGGASGHSAGAADPDDDRSGWLDRLLGPFGATGAFLDGKTATSGATGTQEGERDHHFGLGSELTTEAKAWLDRLLSSFGGTGGFLDGKTATSGATETHEGKHDDGFGLGPELWTDLTRVGGLNDPLHRSSSTAGGADDRPATGIGAAFSDLDGGHKDPFKDIFKPSDHEPKH
jgi:hypothetical protein